MRCETVLNKSCIEFVVVMVQNENVKSVKDALEQLVCKESLQGYTCTKSKVEVRHQVLFDAVITSTDDIRTSSEVAKVVKKCKLLKIQRILKLNVLITTFLAHLSNKICKY